MSLTQEQAPAAFPTFTREKQGIDFTALVKGIEEFTRKASVQIEEIRRRDSNKKEMSIAEMFELQLSMNKLSQFSEMSTSVVTAMHGAIAMMARNLKG